MSNAQLLRWMFRFVSPVKMLALIACLWLILGVGIEVLMPREMGRVIDLITRLDQEKTQVQQSVWQWLWSGEGIGLAVMSVVALVLVSAVVGYMKAVSAMKLSMNMVYHLREAVYDKLQRAGFAFHDTINSGQLINRALNDLNNVRAFLQTCILNILEIVLIVLGFIILLASKQPWVAACAMAPLPLWIWYILRFSEKVRPVIKEVVEANDRNVQIITENIAGVHVVKAFATEQAEITKYSDNSEALFGRIRRRIRLFMNFHPVIRSIAMATQIALGLATAYMIIHGKMHIGDLLVVGWAMGAILGRLQQVAAINEQYQNAIVSAQRLHEVLAAPPAVDEKPEAVPMPPGQGKVSFRGVSFGYDRSKPVLHDVSFEVPGGAMVAIVGPSGAGKSTLVSLISRFYDAQEGTVLIDGVDVRDVKLHALRSQVAYVFQETFLFSDTVAKNIAYGRPDATQGEIEIAARLAQAHEFIDELPLKYESILAERGSSLSGGQRQRLAIARAIVQNPRVLVLDDATAAVDPETEDLIRKGMRFAMRGRTTIVIAHRLSTVKAADLVLVMEDGRITQRGTHAELMRQDGHYRQIAAAQLHGDQDAHAATSPSHMKRVHAPQTFAAAATISPPESGEEIP